MNSTGIIILAAGSSSRFGSTKQLLPFNGSTLIQHVVSEAVDSGAKPVIVVTGASADKVSKDIKKEEVHIIFNERWKGAMASSIYAGMQAALGYRGIEKIIITVSDQPFVSSSLFKQLYQAQEDSGKQIITCAYADTIGTPVLFTKNYFDLLLSLRGEEGAKKIIKANKNDMAVIDFPEGYLDIDTREDLENFLIKKEQGNK
jgi:molybdenum cofactor cytidylyltransferase